MLCIYQPHENVFPMKAAIGLSIANGSNVRKADLTE